MFCIDWNPEISIRHFENKKFSFNPSRHVQEAKTYRNRLLALLTIHVVCIFNRINFIKLMQILMAVPFLLEETASRFFWFYLTQLLALLCLNLSNSHYSHVRPVCHVKMHWFPDTTINLVILATVSMWPLMDDFRLLGSFVHTSSCLWKWCVGYRAHSPWCLSSYS